MDYLAVLFGVLCMVLVIRDLIVRNQIRDINRMLAKRLNEKTSQPVSIQLVDKELNKLAANINKCLKAEENLRLRVVNEEDNFKDMIANISHDLRTPLTAVKGYIQLLSNSELDSTSRNQLDIAQKHTEELGNLIEHFFEYTYLLDAKPQINYEKIDITSLTIECIAAAFPQIEAAGLKINVSQDIFYVYADRQMTTRIVQNLVRNCIAHAKQEIWVEFEVVNEKSNEYVVMHFINNVDTDKNGNFDTTKMFERFYVGDDARKTTGLGLAIVKLLTTQMQGSAIADYQNGRLDISITLKKYCEI